MTERKPPGVSFETWADQQIREAEERGDFARLPGAGKPLASLDAPYDEAWWIKDKMRQEGLAALPPSLIVRKEAEDAMAAVAAARSEQRVREILAEINDRIRETLARPQEGPPLNMGLFDVERTVTQWREQQAGREAAEAAAREAVPEAVAEEAAELPSRRAGLGRLFRRRRAS
ncbi:protein of unknown function [Actinacidiphila alni]|uniref:DnaJ homologue subfamily C member 28 conserved domain-containing protein n=1 Tax=Actinacidiphila alni TaxID=380248 RepID=A0A1I1ZG23_9ACTN|nr:protein of unknown function [Actinacidiphila alni]